VNLAYALAPAIALLGVCSTKSRHKSKNGLARFTLPREENGRLGRIEHTPVNRFVIYTQRLKTNAKFGALAFFSCNNLVILTYAVAPAIALLGVCSTKSRHKIKTG
jgi:hypothetical protein